MSFSWEKTLIYHFLGKKRILFAVLNTLGNYKYKCIKTITLSIIDKSHPILSCILRIHMYDK